MRSKFSVGVEGRCAAGPSLSVELRMWQAHMRLDFQPWPFTTWGLGFGGAVYPSDNDEIYGRPVIRGGMRFFWINVGPLSLHLADSEPTKFVDEGGRK